jgi:hypothetical protein
MKPHGPSRPWPLRRGVAARPAKVPEWQDTAGLSPGGGTGIARQAALLAGLRRAHRSLEALSAAMPGWRRQAAAAELEAGLNRLGAVTAEALHRVEFILAQLRQSSGHQPGWFTAGELAFPKEGEPAGDAALAALAHWALGRLAARGLALAALAHEAGEFQAAHLLRLSVEEARQLARGLVPHLRPGPIAPTCSATPRPPGRLH